MEYYSEIPLASLIEQAKSGDINVARDLYYMYIDPGKNPHPEINERDEAEAEKWRRILWELQELEIKREYERQREQIEDGDKDALYDLYQHWRHEADVGAKECGREYRELLEQAAEGGDRDAMYDLARFAEQLDRDGYSTVESPHYSLHWTRRAANLGHRKALNVLAPGGVESLSWYAGYSWQDPSFLDKQIPTDLEWIRRAAKEANDHYQRAEKGDSEAQFEMGRIFLGYGEDYWYCLISTNSHSARDWFLQAAAQGHEGAIAWLEDQDEWLEEDDPE